MILTDETKKTIDCYGFEKAARICTDLSEAIESCKRLMYCDFDTMLATEDGIPDEIENDDVLCSAWGEISEYFNLCPCWSEKGRFSADLWDVCQTLMKLKTRLFGEGNMEKDPF